MTDRAGLERGAGRPDPGSTPAAAGSLFGPEEDQTARRRVGYVVLASGLLLLAVAGHGVEELGAPVHHTLLGTVATLLAVVVGALALVRFYSRRRTTYLFIGTGFLGTAVLDGFHTFVTFPLATVELAGMNPDLSAWTWLASRIFLALFLAVSWLVWRLESRAGERGEESPAAREYSVYLTAAVLTVVITAFFAQAPLARAYYPDFPLPRPAELIPGFIFLVATWGYLRKGEWGRSAFEHWLVVALILSVAIQFGFVPFSTVEDDPRVLMARALQILSYGAVLAGLMASVYLTFRREEEASSAILKANEALAREVRVRREAERVLQEGEERLQDFLDNANDLIQSTDPDGRILYVNEAWKRTLGYQDHELESLDIVSVVHPEARPRFRTVMERVFDGEAVADFQVAFQAKDGRKVICSGSSNCRFENGRPVATRSILRDVTEQIRAERELAHSQANVRALFESTGDAIWSVNREYRLITFNTAYALTVEAITGRAPSVGDPLQDVVGAEDREWFQGCYDRALSGIRFSAVREEELDGQTRSYELFFNPIEGEDRPSGVVVFSKDISRRRRVEEALRRAKQESEEANRAKSQFMANMSHELRTPLNSVIGFANILLKDPKGQLEARERGFLERILANGKHLLTLINEILDLSKIEAGRMELDLELVDLPELVGETLSQLEGQVGGKPVKLRGEWDEEVDDLHTDPAKLKQVLINLVGNALKFTEEGEVAVRIQTEEGTSTPDRILVQDTGVGIPDERLEAIFEAFQQADAGTARRFGGTGLGLAISRSLCTLMGHELTVESEVGKGSTFTIHLGPPPVAEEEEGIRELEESPRARWAPRGSDGLKELSGKKILVVDDEEDSRTLLTHYLEELGCQVVSAVDGVDGLEMARKVRPDLITLDLMMPRMDGWELLRAIRGDSALRDIPVVVVSIAAKEGRGQFLGAVDILDKPVDRDALVQVLRRSLAGDSGRVLVVEDNPDTRLLLQRYLREAGLVVHTVENGQAALSFLEQTDVDLVILDLIMPVMDGFTMLQRLRSGPEKNMVPVVVLTAKELSSDERSRLDDQANRVIVKGEDVEERLRGILDLHFGPGRKGG